MLRAAARNDVRVCFARRGRNVSAKFCCRNVLMSGPGSRLLLAASASRAASVALETCTVSHQGEVSALLAGLTFIAFDASFADQLGFASFSQRFHGAGDRLRESRRCDRLGR